MTQGKKILAQCLPELGAWVAAAHDLARDDGIAAFAAFMAEREAGLDLLINGAGATWAEPRVT